MMQNGSSRKGVPAIFLGLLLAALIIAVYWPAATFDFVRWDDQQHLMNNPYLHPPSWGHIAELWGRPYFGLYVPVTYTLWGLVAMAGRAPGVNGGQEFNPYLFHSVNIALHIAAGILVWRIAWRLVGNSFAAWVGALFFAMHPVCVEPVAWVSGLRDVLSGVLGFAAIWSYVRSFSPGRGVASGLVEKAEIPSRCDRAKRRNEGVRIFWYGLATLFFVLAILAKPTAVAVVVMVGVAEMIWFCGKWKNMAAKLAPWGLAAIALAVATRKIQGGLAAVDVAAWWQRPVIAADAICFYLGKLFWPVGSCVQYDHTPHRVLASGMGWLWIGIVVVVGVGVYFLGRWQRWVWLAGGLFIAGLLPVLGFVPFGFQYFSTVADRYMYFALLGPAMAVAFFVAGHPTRITYAVCAAMLIVCGGLSYRQVWTWQNTETLFRHALAVNPQSNMALVKLSRERLMVGDAPAAERLARRALVVRPDDSRAWVNLGAALEDLHRPGEARDCYERVIRTDPSRDSAGAYCNLAAMDAEKGDLAEAIRLYEQALVRDPDLAEARLGMARAKAAEGGK